MRRGHPGISGWRNENPRHFRPRTGGTSHYRPSRSYNLLETPRFPPTNPRPSRPQVFNTSSGLNEPHNSNFERNPYKNLYHHVQTYNVSNRDYDHRQRQDSHYDRHPNSKDHSQRATMPVVHSLRQNNANIRHNSPYKDTFYEDSHHNQTHINNMGDVDHRQYPHQNPAWSKTNDIRAYFNQRHDYNKPQRPDNITSIPVHTGQRPHSSDYYSSNAGPVTENSAFSRSVDDTVDIVRKRLMNRGDTQSLAKDPEDDIIQDKAEPVHVQEQPKKRIQRQKHNVKVNCDKIKSKIVHQLFKMDKTKIHKLMDNPNSSTKFEYAISSLITESQNSFNRHLRSEAEKSLCGEDFIQNNQNTIYEDTFMKQMQCILDPQDTVLLEDIKPIVMAELGKVLQLDELDHRFDIPDHQIEDVSYEQCYNDPNYDAYPESAIYEGIQSPEYPEGSAGYEYEADIKPKFERQPSRNSCDIDKDRRVSIENRRHSRHSSDSKHTDEIKTIEGQPLFDSNAEQFSEDEDPFAELDQQYHVVVDHNFLDTGDLSPSNPVERSVATLPDVTKTENISTPVNLYVEIKKEIDSQLNTLAKSPIKLTSGNRNSKEEYKEIKNEHMKNNSITEVKTEVSVPMNEYVDNTESGKNKPPESHQAPKENFKQDTNSSKSITPSNSRKRSSDQRPSHRKEKRKKSDTSQNETNKQILNKNIIINVNDCPSNNEKCRESAKSIFNLFFTKNNSGKETKDENKVGAIDKAYSDKYVKRKETPNKSKEKESQPRKRNSSISSHSMISPKENTTPSNVSQSPTKADSKTKLKTINMFEEQPKKVNIHTSHRNTASTPVTAAKTAIENKSKPLTSIGRKVTKRHVSTQVMRKVHSIETQTVQTKSSSKLCQTDQKKMVSTLAQTEPVYFKPVSKSTDTLERMKEIDLEIQVLLQEKFKLYSSLESRDSCSSTMETLGMTVLNVTPVVETSEDTNEDSADAIVADFTSIPVEELEQIALESAEVQEELKELTTENRRRPKKLKGPAKCYTPTRRKKSIQTPYISLIEQIITDERPLEDIISLDDFEEPPKTKKKPQKLQRPKKKIGNNKTKIQKSVDVNTCIIKDCSVVLIRMDISKYLRSDMYIDDEQSVVNEYYAITDGETGLVNDNVDGTAISEPQTELVEETVVDNDLQFDMLDVSEDIVIGEMCEMKSAEYKEIEKMVISEEVILDNSQSSCEDVAVVDPEQNTNECKTFDYSADDNLRRDSITVTGNADAVLAIECIENNFVAACLDGNVYYFNGDGQLLTTLRGSNLAVTCLTIVKEKYGTTVYTGSLDSRIRYYDLETGLEKGPECNVLSPIQTMDRAWDTVFVGTRTGFVLQFECKNNMLIPVSTVKFSEQSILALRAMKEGPRKVLLVASRSENITIKDAQTGLLLRTLTGPKMTVYTLLYEDGKVYCGTSSHQIHVFDYSSGCLVGSHEGGKGAVCLRASGGLLFAGCYDGCVYVYREGESRPLAQLRGPSLMLLSLAIVGSKIIAGYKDRSLYIWKIPLSILQEMIL